MSSCSKAGVSSKCLNNSFPCWVRGLCPVVWGNAMAGELSTYRLEISKLIGHKQEGTKKVPVSSLLCCQGLELSLLDKYIYFYQWLANLLVRSMVWRLLRQAVTLLESLCLWQPSRTASYSPLATLEIGWVLLLGLLPFNHTFQPSFLSFSVCLDPEVHQPLLVFCVWCFSPACHKQGTGW